MSRLQFAPKTVGETIDLSADFASKLYVDSVILTASVTATVYSGTDAAPQAIVSGSPVISGQTVTQTITGGVAGVVYLLTFQANTAGLSPQLAGFLLVGPVDV